MRIGDATRSWPSTARSAQVFIQIKSARTARAARSFLSALIRACPLRIRTILTENEPKAKFQRSYNGREFTDRFVITGECTPTG